MLELPVIRWGKPYDSLEKDDVLHFLTGEPIARVSQANAGLLSRDMRQAQRARDVLRDFTCVELIERMKKAGELFLTADLPLGDGTQTPDDFAEQQSASTGLPVHMCKGNMQKNHFVLSHMDQMLDALTRGLDLAILSKGYGVESRGVTVSYQAQSPVVGLVLPSNAGGSSAQAGPPRTMDTVPDAGGHERSRHPDRSDLDLSRRCRCGGGGSLGLRPEHDFRRYANG